MLKRLFVLSTLYICSFGTGFANGSTIPSSTDLLAGPSPALQAADFPSIEKILETKKSISNSDPLRSILDVNEFFGLNEDASRIWATLGGTDSERAIAYLSIAEDKTPTARSSLSELIQLKRRLTQYFESSYLNYRGTEVDFDLTLVRKGEPLSIPISHPLFSQLVIETVLRDTAKLDDESSDEARGSVVNRLMALSLMSTDLGLARAGLFPCPARAPLSKFMELNIVMKDSSILKRRYGRFWQVNLADQWKVGVGGLRSYLTSRCAPTTPIEIRGITKWIPGPDSAFQSNFGKILSAYRKLSEEK